MALSDPSASAPREQMDSNSSGCVRDGSNVGRWMIGTRGQSLVVKVCMQRLRKEVGGKDTFGVRRRRLLARLSRKSSLSAYYMSIVSLVLFAKELGDRLTASERHRGLRLRLNRGR